MLGVDLDSKGSTFQFAALTPVWANDGRAHVVGLATGTHASTANVTLGAAGSTSAAASAGVANSYNVNTTGGVVIGQYFWAKANFI
jgi:hypothetical protein